MSEHFKKPIEDVYIPTDEEDVKGAIGGHINPADESAYVSTIRVDEKERKRGLGTFLMNKFTRRAKKAGAKTIGGKLTSEEAVHLRQKIFKEGNTYKDMFGNIISDKQARDYISQGFGIDVVSKIPEDFE